VKTVIIGEAFGKSEAEFSHPLVGPSGRELSLELGISGLAPFLTKLCRKCNQITRFMDPRCEHCSEHLWPNEFDLIDHWKRLRETHGIAVTNVFSRRPPPLFHWPDWGWTAVEVLNEYGRKAKIRRVVDGHEQEVESRNISFNNLGWFFGTERQTPMPPWKASKLVPGTHLKQEFFHHLESLWREVESLSPNLCVLIGNAPCWAVLGQTAITKLRGTVAMSNKALTGLEIKCLPTFHPAAVLRQMPMRVSCLADYQKAAREAEFPEIVRPERYIYIVDPTEDGLRLGYEWLKRPASAYANDIETARGQITMVGFARSPSDAMVVPFRNQDLSSYWPTAELEFKAWKLVIAGLESPVPKIFQNGVYDLSYFIRMGIHVNNAQHDTMLWHHSEYPELPKSLGYLGSVYCNDVAWKTMVRHGNELKRDE